MIKLKKLFKKLQPDTNSVLFMQETINEKLLKNVKAQNMMKTNSL